MVNAMFGLPYKTLVANFGFAPFHLMPPYGISPAKITPQLIGVPQVSTRYNWGPWYSKQADNGRADFIFDSTIAPETFGSIEQMNAVGRYYAAVINSNIAGVDSGSIELAEYPKGNIGERFFVSGPYITSMSVSLSTSGYKTTYDFNTWTPEFGKLSKQNIDRLTNTNKSIIKYKNNTSAILFRKFNFPKGNLPTTQLGPTYDRFKKTTRTLRKGLAMAIAGPDPNDPTKPDMTLIDDVWQQNNNIRVTEARRKLANELAKQKERYAGTDQALNPPRLGYTVFTGKKKPPEPPEENP